MLLQAPEPPNRRLPAHREVWVCWGLQEGLVPTAGWRWGAPALWFSSEPVLPSAGSQHGERTALQLVV